MRTLLSLAPLCTALLFAALICTACLGVDPPPARDATLPSPPSIRGVEVADFLGRPWPIEHAPRWPRVRVTASEPLSDPSLVLIVRGTLDGDLAGDLAQAPLRSSTLERLVLLDREVQESAIVATPAARLEPGSYVVALPAWARGASELALEHAFAIAMEVSAAPLAGSSLRESWPPDGAAAVAPSLGSIALGFDGPLGALEGITLTQDGLPIEARAGEAACDRLGLGAASCVEIVPARSLEPARSYTVELDARLTDGTGAPIGPARVAFTTATTADVEAPRALELACSIDEVPDPVGCLFADDARVSLRVQLAEPVRLELELGGRYLYALAPRGSASFTLLDLPPDAALEGVLRATDTAGLVASFPIAIATTEPLATIAIDEVRADPNGAEPRQEYVEVVNYGAMPVELSGTSLSDAPASEGDLVVQSWTLAPGQRALLVADDFDPDDPADDPVPAGVPLVHMGRSLGSGGLTNAGEPLFLRDALGRRLSAAPALAAPGACLVRRASDMRTGEASEFAIAPCTPGRATP